LKRVGKSWERVKEEQRGERK